MPEDDVLSRVGALQAITFRNLPEEEYWNPEQDAEINRDDTTMSMGSSRGILVEVGYEKMTYTAILLRSTRPEEQDESVVSVGESERDGFQHFPLMLVRMPGSLRETFVEFLASAFDTRVSVLALPGTYLTSGFEQYISDLCTNEMCEIDIAEGSRNLRTIIKDTELFIGFDLPNGSATLKTVDIHIAREDLPRMVVRGKKISRQRDRDGESPFMDALATYVKGHLALDLRHERVKVVRIACGAFVLGAEGKLKLFQPARGDDGETAGGRATGRLIGGLLRTAIGGSFSGDVVGD